MANFSLLQFRRHVLLLMVMCVWQNHVLPQSLSLSFRGPRTIGMGGIIALTDDNWAVAGNPAGLAGYSKISAATAAEQRYLLEEMGIYAFCGTLPLKSGCTGLLAIYSGYQLCHEEVAGVCYGRNFGQKMQAGIELFYFHGGFGENYQGFHLVTFKAGLLYPLNSKLTLGFTTLNPFQLCYKSEKTADMPCIYALAAGYDFTDDLFLAVECEKELSKPLLVKTGMEYSFRKLFQARIGISMLPLNISFGAGIRYGHFQIDISSTIHQYLGYTPQISISYEIRQ